MIGSGLVEVGSHGVSHTILSLFDKAGIERELADSKDILEAMTQQKITSFCYPNGLAGDFDERTDEKLGDCDYQTALTSLEGSNLLNGAKRFRLLRVHTGLPRHAFIKEISGMGAFVRRREPPLRGSSLGPVPQ